MCLAILELAGVSNLLVSLVHTGRRVVLGHTLHTQTLTKTKIPHNVLSTFTILHWAALLAILGHRLEHPWLTSSTFQSSCFNTLPS